MIQLKKLLSILMIASFTFAAVAENVKIHGKITDQEEKPVEFATIRIAGTSIGTNSDLEGNYSLTVAPKDTLEVIYSCIGFKNVTRRLIPTEYQRNAVNRQGKFQDIPRCLRWFGRGHAPDYGRSQFKQRNELTIFCKRRLFR